MAQPKIKKNAVVLTARDLLKGYVADKYDVNLYNMSPLQMLPAAEKDDEWKKWNMDWLERAGMRQLVRESPRMIKNYNLANGVIDKTDYMLGADNPMNNMIGAIVDENTSNLPLKFFPIIPNVINVMLGEFNKRDNKIIVGAVDNLTQTEKEEAQMNELRQLLVKKAQSDMLLTLAKLGHADQPDMEAVVQQSMETAKQIADLKTKYKNYRTIPEQWANHIVQSDTERDYMYQMETVGFRDLLITDREFWHINVKEDDYRIELWNPLYTFYHKSPNTQYISEGNYVGRMLMMSIPDVIDNYGDLMTEEQLLELKHGYKIISNMPLVTAGNSDQLNWYTNYSKSYPNSITNTTWGKYMDGKFMDHMEKQMNGVAPSNNSFDFSWYDLNTMPMDYMTALDTPGMVRVTEAYWKSQRRVGLLTKRFNGDRSKDIVIRVDENFEVTEKPIYDNSISQEESAKTLHHGEHVEWTWINEVRKGIKINSSLSSYYTRNYSTFEPIYIGGDPIPFQFKGQDEVYGARLPVEGFVSSERNSVSMSLVDKMKSYQVLFNVLHNQIMEMIADDVGMVIVLDQNMIPRNSMNGEWGKYNFAQFYQVMKDYQIAPLDTNIRNTEMQANFQHFQQLDMSKTQQLLTRMKLAEWAKQQALEVVGITPQRLGSVAASESATGVRQAVNNSYAQTAPYFDSHMIYLMPRVKQMALDAAQFIMSSKPDSRVAYISRDDEREFFRIEGDRLLLRDFRIYAKSTANIKDVLEKLRAVAENNTAGGSLYDLAQIVTLQSPSEIISKLREADEKRQQEVEAQREHEMQIQQMQNEAMDKAAQRADYWKGKEIEKDILVAQIRASQSKTNDVNTDGIPDSLEALDLIEQQRVNTSQILNMNDKMNFERTKHEDEMNMRNEEMNLKRQEMASKERIEQLKAKTALKNKVAGEKSKKK